MKKWMWIAIVVVVAGVGVGLYFWLGQSAKAVVQPPPTAKVERASLRQIVQSTGKVISNLDVDIKCKASGEIVSLPFDVSDPVRKGQMLMKLDPVDEDRAVRQSQVALDSSQARLNIAQTNLLVAERTLKTDRDRAQSALTAAQARAADAAAKAGRVKDLLDKKLASLEDYETAQTAAILADADSKSALIRTQEIETQAQALELARQQVALATSQVESDRISLDLSKQRRADTEVPAPIDGVVSANNVQIGQIVSSGISNVGGGTTVLTLSDLSRMFILASVDESDIGKVKIGQDVSITVDAYKDKKFAGKVVRISTAGVSISNVVTFEVKIEVQPGSLAATDGPQTPPATGSSRPMLFRPRRPDADSAPAMDPAAATGPASTTGSAPARGPRRSRDAGGESDRGDKSLLKPVMTANVDVICAERNDVLTVPADCVIRKGGKVYVTLMGEGDPKDAPVEIGLSDGLRTEILSGVSEGQTVQVYKNNADTRWKGQPQGNPVRAMGGGRRG